MSVCQVHMVAGASKATATVHLLRRETQIERWCAIFVLTFIHGVDSEVTNEAVLPQATGLFVICWDIRYYETPEFEFAAAKSKELSSVTNNHHHHCTYYWQSRAQSVPYVLMSI